MNLELWHSYQTEEGQVPAIDRAFGERFGRTEEEKLFLSYLLGASRSGSLFVEVSPLTPSPEELYGPLHRAAELKAKLASGSAVLSPEAPVAIDSGRFFLKRLFEARLEVLAHWKRLTFSSPALKVVVKEERLTEEQRSAVEGALQHSPFLLTGGPGTGKTYTAACFLRAYLQLHPQSRIAIAAPTGKAALHLEQTLKRSLGFSGEAMTLHRLAGHKATLLPYDLYLVDEGSMIDIELMASWLKKVRTGARVLLLGDPNQLPPVECGSLFQELADKHPHIGRLTLCQRAERKDLVECAHTLLEKGVFIPSESVRLIDTPEEEIRRFAEHFPNHADAFSPLLFDEFARYRILSPLRKGAYGVEGINQLLLQLLYRKNKSRFFPMPILITANDPTLKLFNGETALLMKSGSPFDPPAVEDKVHFADGRTLPALLLPHYELAYCITVHKSQGSEFDHVLLLLGCDPLSQKRSLLYTAATRAKKQLSICRFPRF